MLYKHVDKLSTGGSKCKNSWILLGQGRVGGEKLRVGGAVFGGCRVLCVEGWLVVLPHQLYRNCTRDLVTSIFGQINRLHISCVVYSKLTITVFRFSIRCLRAKPAMYRVVPKAWTHLLLLSVP